GAAGGQPAADGGSDAGLAAPTLAPAFVTAARAACEFSAPMAITSRNEAEVLVATADGTIAAVDPVTGAEVWHVSLTAPAEMSAHLAAPPVLVDGDRLVVAWQDVLSDWTRTNHHLAVVDLEARALDPTFPAVTLAASKPVAGGAGTVNFVPAHAYSRAALVHAPLPGHALGLVYASYGNVRDLQPFHGWLFEVDLDAWKSQGAAAAVTASLVTTADNDCGPENGDGARQMLCGGGVWSHRGPQVVANPLAPDGFELLVPTGNGLLDPTRGDFANAVLRTGHGLAFDPGCDPLMCGGFDALSPSEACVASCDNLFMPRLLPNQAVPEGPNRACVGMTLLGCYAALDWDLGASAPAVTALPGGPTVILQPGKDGSVYLFDAAHLGTLYDRAPLMAGCGEGGGRCQATWAGTIVTRPEIVTLDGAVIALVPTFVMDDVHPAGLQAIEISAAGGSPHLVPRWQAPRFDDPESVTAFRGHPSGVTVVDVDGQPFAAVVDPGPPGGRGTLYWVRVRDGQIVQRVRLAGPGQRFAPPLAVAHTLYVPSCDHTGTPSFNEGPSHLEAFSISAR
ncbi:MAG TPA: hypothetical protein VHM31_10740, partial [Polyangia bacterium]|nr:hypothetical protein [Polyangia bacterium]